MALTYADLRRGDFFSRPEWRWERVLELTSRNPVPGRCTRRDDDYVRRARAFHIKWTRQYSTEAGRRELFFEEPGLFHAYQIHEKADDDPEGAMYLQARLLAGQTPEQIFDAMGLDALTVEWYEAVFFNVLDRLKRRDWITKQVLLPAMLRHHDVAADEQHGIPFRDSSVARPFLDGSLKMFAYFGGPHLVDLLITGFQSGKPLARQEDLNNWLDANWATTIRRRSAIASQQFEINKYNVLELFQIHTRIIEIDRSEESQDAARTTTERHIKAMLDELPFVAGDAGRKLAAGAPTEPYDDQAGELRDDELLFVASTNGPPQLADEIPKSLPAPRKIKATVLDARNEEL